MIHDVIVRSLDGSQSTCRICCKTYMHYSTAKRHFNECHAAKMQEFKCRLCDKVYTRFRSLKYHLASAHKKENKIWFSKLGLLLHHEEAMNNPDSLMVTKEGKCLVCGKVFANSQNARRHAREIHMESTSEYKCHICGSTYGRNRAYKEHMGKVHGLYRKLIPRPQNSSHWIYTELLQVAASVRIMEAWTSIPTWQSLIAKSSVWSAGLSLLQ